MKNIKAHRIFIGLALAGIFILFIFTILTKHSLGNDPDLKGNIKNFYDYNFYLTYGNYIVYFILLFVANIMFIQHRYWDTFIWAGIIFTSYTLIDWWWLSEIIFHYKKTNELWMGEFNLSPMMGILIALLGLAIAIGNYLLLKRIVKEKHISSIEEMEKQQKNIPN